MIRSTLIVKRGRCCISHLIPIYGELSPPHTPPLRIRKLFVRGGKSHPAAPCLMLKHSREMVCRYDPYLPLVNICGHYELVCSASNIFNNSCVLVMRFVMIGQSPHSKKLTSPCLTGISTIIKLMQQGLKRELRAFFTCLPKGSQA